MRFPNLCGGSVASGRVDVGRVGKGLWKVVLKAAEFLGNCMRVVGLIAVRLSLTRYRLSVGLADWPCGSFGAHEVLCQDGTNGQSVGLPGGFVRTRLATVSVSGRGGRRRGLFIGGALRCRSRRRGRVKLLL